MKIEQGVARDRARGHAFRLINERCISPPGKPIRRSRDATQANAVLLGTRCGQVVGKAREHEADNARSVGAPDDRCVRVRHSGTGDTADEATHHDVDPTGNAVPQPKLAFVILSVDQDDGRGAGCQQTEDAKRRPADPRLTGVEWIDERHDAADGDANQ